MSYGAAMGNRPGLGWLGCYIVPVNNEVLRTCIGIGISLPPIKKGTKPYWFHLALWKHI
jgi:hypothetical protein